MAPEKASETVSGQALVTRKVKNENKRTYKPTFKWLKTKIGLLRLFQLIVLMTSITVISITKDKREQQFSSIDAFWISHSFTIATVATTLIAYTTDVSSKVPAILRSLGTKIVLCSLAYLSLIGSSAWMVSKHHTNGVVVISGLFGILGGFLFVIENMFYVVSVIKSSDCVEYQHMADGTA